MCLPCLPHNARVCKIHDVQHGIGQCGYSTRVEVKARRTNRITRNLHAEPMGSLKSERSLNTDPETARQECSAGNARITVKKRIWPGMKWNHISMVAVMLQPPYTKAGLPTDSNQAQDEAVDTRGQHELPKQDISTFHCVKLHSWPIHMSAKEESKPAGVSWKISLRGLEINAAQFTSTSLRIQRSRHKYSIHHERKLTAWKRNWFVKSQWD